MRVVNMVNTAELTDEQVDALDYHTKHEKAIIKQLNHLEDRQQDYLQFLEVLFLTKVLHASRWMISASSSIIDFRGGDYDIEDAVGFGSAPGLFKFEVYTGKDDAEGESINEIVEKEPTRWRESVILKTLELFGQNPARFFSCSIFGWFLYLMEKLGDNGMEKLIEAHPEVRDEVYGKVIGEPSP